MCAPYATESGNFGMLFLCPEGQFFYTAHFPPGLKHHPFKGNDIYLILGKVTEEFGFSSMEVEKLAELRFEGDPRY